MRVRGQVRVDTIALGDPALRRRTVAANEPEHTLGTAAEGRLVRTARQLGRCVVSSSPISSVTTPAAATALSCSASVLFAGSDSRAMSSGVGRSSGFGSVAS